MTRPTAFALALVLGTTASAVAETTTSRTNGVEIIITQPDRIVRPRKASARKPTPLAAQPVAPRMRELAGSQALVRLALANLGVPYLWGGTTPAGFDCSGFTWYAFSRLGIAIPRTADLQFAAGRTVDGAPLPGDLVFFQTYDYGASHVGIYLGDGRFVNAIGRDVHVATFASEYFRSRYLGARRFLAG